MISWYDEAVNRINNLCNFEYPLILEVGAGLGHFTFKLKKHFYEAHLVAIDINSENIKHIFLNNKLKAETVHWLIADGEHTPLRNKVVNIAVSSFSLQYWENPLNVFNELSRLTGNTGRFLITDLRKDMKKSTMKKIAELSALNNPGASPEEIEKFLKIRLEHCYTPKEVDKIAKKSRLRNWRITSREYGFYFESLPAP
ncbi:MAG: class I SAM-dependent methyltransferase [Candidatus Odinarchaeum yellowstonii]|uniref:Class I SAM-dependent methyltransferase n=1 Tax=Odinarchaeota yellowstonii (strain LCB_4) TaxID=1841599 RepID=A0AAF0IBP9_ODILC|nr:MAG: class I SAM-dependent methyltransferase [Candidatus Odinarchaeum yellowstonii]